MMEQDFLSIVDSELFVKYVKGKRIERVVLFPKMGLIFTIIPQRKNLSLGERECLQGSVYVAVNAFYRMERNSAFLLVQLLL